MKSSKLSSRLFSKFNFKNSNVRKLYYPSTLLASQLERNSALYYRRNFFQTSSSVRHKCELTADRYSVTRGNYNKIEPPDLTFFIELLGQSRVITDEADLESANTDWLSIVRGSSKVLLKPSTTEEVSKILKYCSDRTLAVCPQGGNTGLVGGSVPVFDEIIISTSLMNKIENVEPLSGVLRCQAGCILEELDNMVAGYELMMPLDLGAKGSCHIGGNVSTNAGGLRLLRYGNLHGSVLGVEAVLASGEIIDCLSEMKKDNTGYDLKHLFIGSEGTLGFVTRVTIQCPPRPSSVNLTFVGLESFDKVMTTLKLAKQYLGEILSSCELIDRESLKAVEQNLHLNSPVVDCPFYMLIETSGSSYDHDDEKLQLFFVKIMDEKIITDGILAGEPTKMAGVWAIRENIAEALLRDGYVYKYDISLPIPKFYSIVEDLREVLQKGVIRITGYGHLGDGNVHVNISSKEYDKEVLDAIEPFVYEVTAKHKGSVSAEHGLGFKKKNFISYSKSPSAIALMKRMKKLLDPKGILNPYKVLPD